MRITAGKYRSRTLETLPGDATRPTSDKVKEALFSSLGGYLYDQSVLDLFGGSGGIGLEALSRGAKEAYICDQSIKAITVIKKNIQLLKETEAVVIQANYKSALLQLKEKKFDFVFLDPPYDMDVSKEILETLQINDMLYEHSVVVVESDTKLNLNQEVNDFEISKEKKYGRSKLTYYRRK